MTNIGSNRKRALVTGGAGFIGSHMAERLLEDGYEVVIIDNESTGSRENVPAKAKYIFGDVRDPKSVEQAFSENIDLVLQIAGQASNVRSFDDPFSDLQTNVIGTLNILNACLQNRVPRLLFASSMTSYGHPSKLPVVEDEAPRPISYYGITKYAAERYVMSTALRHDLDFSFNVTAFRMFNVYGERQRLDNPYQGALGFFLGNVLRNEPVIIHSDGEQTRDFVHISDVVNAWMAALDSPNSYQQVFNLGFGEAISINRLVDTILSTLGHSRENYQVNYGPLRPGDQRHMVADISHIQKLLGWKPRVSLPEGIQVTLNWARKEIERIHG